MNEVNLTLRTFPALEPAECFKAGSEIEKFRHLIAPHCVSLNGFPLPTLELASGGAVSVPWAISFDLPKAEYAKYNSNHQPRGPIHARGSVFKLPFESDTFSAVIASHILEDFPQTEWPNILNEWIRVVAHGGVLIVAVPDHDLWWDYVKNGGVHNHAHAQPQPRLGDMSRVLKSLGTSVVREEFTRCYEGDFTILAVALKP